MLKHISKRKVVTVETYAFSIAGSLWNETSTNHPLDFRTKETFIAAFFKYLWVIRMWLCLFYLHFAPNIGGVFSGVASGVPAFTGNTQVRTRPFPPLIWFFFICRTIIQKKSKLKIPYRWGRNFKKMRNFSISAFSSTCDIATCVYWAHVSTIYVVSVLTYSNFLFT